MRKLRIVCDSRRGRDHQIDRALGLDLPIEDFLAGVISLAHFFPIDRLSPTRHSREHSANAFP
jgi:hypothetical protein